MLPFEPGRFSATTGWPRSSESRCPMIRAEISGAPPGGIGTISLIGRKGYCAHEAAENRAANATAVKRLRTILLGPPAKAYSCPHNGIRRWHRCPAFDAMIFIPPAKQHVSRTSPRTVDREAEAVRKHPAAPRVVERARFRSRERTQGKDRRAEPFGASLPAVSRPDEARPGLR